MQTPGISVKVSRDMINWQNIDLSDQAPRQFTLGEPIKVRFILEESRQGFFMAEIKAG